MLRRGWVCHPMDSAKLHRTAEKQVNVTCRARAEGKHRAARWPAQRFDGKLPGKLGESLQTLQILYQPGRGWGRQWYLFTPLALMVVLQRRHMGQ
jgi:hypothetical protein